MTKNLDCYRGNPVRVNFFPEEHWAIIQESVRMNIISLPAVFQAMVIKGGNGHLR